MALLLLGTSCPDGRHLHEDHTLSLLASVSHHCPWTSALTVHERQKWVGSLGSQPRTVASTSRVGSRCCSLTRASVFQDVDGWYDSDICFSLNCVWNTLIPCRG